MTAPKAAGLPREVELALTVDCPMCLAAAGRDCVIQRRRSALPVHLTRVYAATAAAVRSVAS